MYQLYFSLALIFIIFSLPIYIYYITLKREQFEDKGSSFFSLFFAEPSLRVVLTVLCFPFIGIISVLSTIKTLCRRKPVKPSLLFSAIVSLLWLAFLLAGLVQYLGE